MGTDTTQGLPIVSRSAAASVSTAKLCNTKWWDDVRYALIVKFIYSRKKCIAQRKREKRRNTVGHGHDTDPTYRFSQRCCVKSAQRSCAISNNGMTSAMHLLLKYIYSCKKCIAVMKLKRRTITVRHGYDVYQPVVSRSVAA